MLPSPQTPARAWHAVPELLARFLADFIAFEASRLRAGHAALPALPWSRETLIDERGLGLDSLQRLAVASALTQSLHLHERGLEDQLLVQRRFGEWLDIASASLGHFDSALTFRTSGSTGSPKVCSHELATLEQEVRFLGELCQGTVRVVSAVPAHHIYGFLFTILLPLLLPDSAVLDVRAVTPQSLHRSLQPGDLLVSHPLHWRLMLEHGIDFIPGVTGVSSTSALSPPSADALADRGLERLIEVYGSSETAGIGWRDSSHNAYRLMPFWARGCDGSDRITRTLPDGSTRVYALGDRLAWQSTELFNVEERLDGAVQVGGINVFPALVRQKLLQHPDVADAAVRLMRPAEGDRLKAFVVPKGNTERHQLINILMQWVQTQLAAPERPQSFTLGSAVPETEHGKSGDWNI